MKQNRILVISIMAADLILAVICMIAYFREDRVRPEFRFQTDEYIYTYEDGEAKLLDNITAYDNRDGDISERIVIEKIMENQDSSTIVVYYAVSDSAGNVAKISRVFVADFREQKSGAEEAEAFGGAPEDNISIMKNNEMDNVLPEQADNEEMETTEGVNDNTAEAGEEDIEEESVSEGNESEERAQEDAQPPAPAEPQPRQEDRSGYPVLTLRTQEVTIEAGTSPPWTEIIETLRDDKDDYATLYYNLSVSRFNRNQEGDYPVSLYTEDSDGNRSDTVSVIVHVR